MCRTLKIMLLLIASILKRVEVKNTEGRHMVTSEKSLKEKAKELRLGETFLEIGRQKQRSFSFIEYLQRLLGPRVEVEEEMDYNKQLPFTFFGTEGLGFPVLHDASAHREQQFACTPFHITENSSFLITVSSDYCDPDTGLELPNSCSLHKFLQDPKEEGYGNN
ncbi:hypothetical protein WISP_131279 [Willisornis vidua]|uniref:Uncharacterized protein n=1 Tax=Willisornis vidua TaxID=1566151 RepID=A0ABQ9CPK3_9PASS|nr:hypothetical protein WISP_131279 [Willisornis vidua]